MKMKILAFILGVSIGKSKSRNCYFYIYYNLINNILANSKIF